MDFEINYYSESVQIQIFELPDAMAARYIVLTKNAGYWP
jgi:hypothetical protein